MCRRRLALVALAVSVVVAGIGSAAQEKPYPICALDHFVNTMKTLGPNFMAVNTSLADQDFATAKERLTRSREQLATTITFCHVPRPSELPDGPVDARPDRCGPSTRFYG